MINLTEFVDYDLAKLLNNYVWGEDKYAAEDLEVTWDNYLGVGKVEEGHLLPNDANYNGKTYYAPLYAEVIATLERNQGIYIDFIPCFTFSTDDHIAYYYKVYKKNDDEGRLDLLIEEKEWMSSFTLAVKTIVSELINRNFIKIF